MQLKLLRIFRVEPAICNLHSELKLIQAHFWFVCLFIVGFLRWSTCDESEAEH